MRKLTILSLLVIVNACSTAPVGISTEFTTSQSLNGSVKQFDQELSSNQEGNPVACKIGLMNIDIEDFMAEQEASNNNIRETNETRGLSLGVLAGRPISIPDTGEWIHNAFYELGETIEGISIVDAPRESSGIINLSLQLKKAYIRSSTTSKAANVVIQAHIQGDKKNETKKLYRGSNTSINWASGEGEVTTAMNTALGESIIAIFKDVVEHCR